ncbi:hypothetical protein A5675_11020 [Mycobacterium malmoense]|uniref:NYN domain-containing protein n=1 Tax=Mycobacterium malmoense TaxID=1780 RepID=UPI00080BB390|nr:NYN domain-containing protein [Mycobacterium malmoense]OCB41044.1 hypothetical protein A5675_11020 [Mycobacterium malmoense]
MPQTQLEQVAVFIDYENVRRSAAGAFLDYGAQAHEGLVDPIELARYICSSRQRASALKRAYVYRGRPSTEHQPKMASYFDKYRDLWERSSAACKVRTRDLKYDFDDDGSFRAREKGIDVWLATDLIAAAIGQKFDALVVVSSDTDLLPAVEYVLYDTPAHIEIAAWGAPGCYPLYVRQELEQGRHRPFCHYLSKSVFEQIRQDGRFD